MTSELALRCWLKVDQNQIIFSMIQQIWRQMKKNVFTMTSWSRVPLTITRNVWDYLDILDHGKSQSIEKINIRQNVRCRGHVPCLLRLKYGCPFSSFLLIWKFEIVVLYFVISCYENENLVQNKYLGTLVLAICRTEKYSETLSTQFSKFKDCLSRNLAFFESYFKTMV